jgi:hypothetical protein
MTGTIPKLWALGQLAPIGFDRVQKLVHPDQHHEDTIALPFDGMSSSLNFLAQCHCCYQGAIALHNNGLAQLNRKSSLCILRFSGGARQYCGSFALLQQLARRCGAALWKL